MPSQAIWSKNNNNNVREPNADPPRLNMAVIL